MPSKGKKSKGSDKGNKDKEELAATPKREAFFQTQFLEDLHYWVETDRNTTLRVLDLVDVVLRDPFGGAGKPEPLKHLGSNIWLRRITQVHRLVYLVRDARIDFLQARFHY